MPDQGYTFDYPDTPTTPNSTDNPSQPDQHTQSSKAGLGVSAPSMVLLEKNQGAVELGGGLLSTREKTKADWGIETEYPSVPFHGGYSNPAGSLALPFQGTRYPSTPFHEACSSPTGSLALAFQALSSPDVCPQPYTDEDTKAAPSPGDTEDDMADFRGFLPEELLLFYKELDEVIEESGGI